MQGLASHLPLHARSRPSIRPRYARDAGARRDAWGRAVAKAFVASPVRRDPGIAAQLIAQWQSGVACPGPAWLAMGRESARRGSGVEGRQGWPSNRPSGHVAGRPL
jgi:hypothetical protein